MIVTATISDGRKARRSTRQERAAGTPKTVLTRCPVAADAAAVSELIRLAGTLEANTTYAYVLLCSHFNKTSAVAICEDKLVGCVLGYRIPERPRTLFLWQIGVDKSLRRQGVARRLLEELFSRSELADVECIETTVAPSNIPSRKLFEGWAEARGFELKSEGLLERSLFGADGSHEPEEILSIRRGEEKS